jgi:hypothetical protein
MNVNDQVLRTYNVTKDKITKVVTSQTQIVTIREIQDEFYACTWFIDGKLCAAVLSKRELSVISA